MPSTLIFDASGPHSPPVLPGQVFNISTPNAPEFRFEWHPESEKVYVIRMAALPLIGEMVGIGVEDHGAALNAVAVWMRGYRTAKMEMIAPHEHIRKLLD